jgi:DNA segregation ATPase FtsK/SpoIIIE-like protein
MEEQVFDDRRYREIFGLLVLVLSILVLLSLMSYHIGDYSLLLKNRSVANMIGPAGAALSHFLRTAFGYSSYFIFFIMVIAGWSILKKGSMVSEVEKVFSMSYLLITTATLISLVFTDIVLQFSGGLIGLYLSVLIEKFSGRVGACIIVIILNLVGLVLLGSMSIATILSDQRRGEIKPLQKIKSFLYRLLARLRGRAPFNRIDRDIDYRGMKRIPWVVKKRIQIGIEDELRDDEFERSPKLLELNHLYEDDDDDASFHYNDMDIGGDTDIYGTEMFQESRDDLLGLQHGSDQMDIDEIVPDVEGVSDGIEVNRIKYLEREAHVKQPIPVNENAYVDELQDSNETIIGLKESELPDDIRGRGAISETEMVNENSLRGSRIFDDIDINGNYIIPTTFLQSSTSKDTESWKSEVKRNSELLVSTLTEFGIESRVTKVTRGPVITLYEMQIAPGIKVNRIVGLSDDIAMALAASRVRIVAPIPGKSAIGVEVPNRLREIVTLGDIIKSKEYQNQYGMLKVALGKDILGTPIMLDLKRLPHLLIAGATGSGKSVLVNSIITSLIYNYTPNHVRFILVDPKMVELQLYNGLPHLLTPVITEAHVVPKALKWTMFEMERRYRLLSELKTRDIDRYNEKLEDFDDSYERLPYIVIIMDELADLMMIASKEIEGFITRIAQKARAVGIHLVLATQRPSVDIITGIIKANFPARVAFQVAQKTDSRTIIDQNGAEKLLGRGDMLYQSPMSSFPVRIQGALISEDESMMIVHHLRRMGKPSYIDIEESIYEEMLDGDDVDMEDELFAEAMKIVEETKKASASYLQRRLSIGYNRAARIIELMEDRGYVGPQQGSKPREVFI